MRRLTFLSLLSLCLAASAQTTPLRLQCEFIRDATIDPHTGQQGQLQNPGPFGSREIDISVLAPDRIAIDLMDMGTPQPIRWYGQTANCRSISTHLPLADADCYDLTYSMHPQANDGQLVLPRALPTQPNEFAEMHSVGEVPVPPIGRLDATDIYWCRRL